MNTKNALIILTSALLLSSCGGASSSATGLSTSQRPANTVDYVLVAEPSMTPALTKNTNGKEYASMATEYAKKSDGKPIMQASIFVKNDVDADKVNAFLGAIKEDINAFVATPTVIDPYVEVLGEDAVKAKLGVPSTAILKNVTKNGNRMGLGFKEANEHKEAIGNFLSLFGLTASEDAYYQGAPVSPASEYELDLKVVSPSGAPAVALYKFLGEPEEKIEINSVASNVVAYLSPNSTKDIVIAPTNAGITAINKKNAPFKIAATITFGNFYLAATGNDANGQLDPDDYVVAFQKDNVPDKIFKYVYADVNFTNLHYVDQASDAATCLITGLNITDEAK